MTILFNNTKDLVILSGDKKLKKNILNALSLAKNVIQKDLGTKRISHESALAECSREGYCRLVLFKYFYRFEDDFVFSEVWLREIYRLSESDYRLVRHEIRNYLPEYAKEIKVTQNDSRAIKRDLRLFFHCCWATKFVLLPLNYNELPKFRLRNGTLREYAFVSYPEILRIIRAPFNNDISSEYDISKYMPPSSLRNFAWYAYRYVRASAAWEVEDISNELLAAISDNRNTRYPRTVDWYLALKALFPTRVKFQQENVYAKSSMGVQGLSQTLSEDNFSSIELKDNPTIPEWIIHINSFVELVKSKGIKQFRRFQSVIRKSIQILIQSDEPLPSPEKIKRCHVILMMSFLKKGNSSASFKSNLYKLESFFDYIEVTFQTFKNPISRKLDFPLARRSKGTNKNIMPENEYATYLSYLYGIAEWVWYVNEHLNSSNSYIRSWRNKNTSLKTNDSGFVPIFRYSNRYYPIEEIPTKLLPTVLPKRAPPSQMKNAAICPHSIHLSIVMAETGIRLIALRWLDSQSYDSDVDRKFFVERSYIPSRLWVNTDKSHNSWSAVVSEAVIGILDRQADWKRKYLKGKDLPRHYDDHENSSFEMVRPLFATPGQYQIVTDSFSVIGDGTYRKVFKNLLSHFRNIYSQLDENDPSSIFFDPNFVPTENLSDSRDNCMSITPHSLRAQVVTNNISILPPSIIRQMTGHTTEAHVMYYAKLDQVFLSKQISSQEAKFKDFIAPIIIDTRAADSLLQKALKISKTHALSDFGGVSFSDQRDKAIRSGIQKVKKSLSEQLAFNATHICPFNNECPEDIKKELLIGLPPCGECPYSVKTIDHIPAISAKIRSLTDKAAEHENVIFAAKQSGENMSAYINDIRLKKYYVGEIAAWATTITCLETMARTLVSRDKWLVAKPQFINDQLHKLESSNELTNIMLRIEEAQSYTEFLTPQLKAHVAIFRNKVLAQTGQFKILLDEAPKGTALLTEFKGIIKGICDVTGVGIQQLPSILDKLALDFKSSFAGKLNQIIKDKDLN